MTPVVTERPTVDRHQANVDTAQREIDRASEGSRAERVKHQTILDQAAASEAHAVDLAASRTDLLRRHAGGDSAAVASLHGLGDQVDAMTLKASDLRDEAARCRPAIEAADARVAEATSNHARAVREQVAHRLHQHAARVDTLLNEVGTEAIGLASDLETYQRAHAGIHNGERVAIAGDPTTAVGFVVARTLAARLKVACAELGAANALHDRWNPAELGSFTTLFASIPHGRD